MPDWSGIFYLTHSSSANSDKFVMKQNNEDQCFNYPDH